MNFDYLKKNCFVDDSDYLKQHDESVSNKLQVNKSISNKIEQYEMKSDEQIIILNL